MGCPTPCGPDSTWRPPTSWHRRDCRPARAGSGGAQLGLVRTEGRQGGAAGGRGEIEPAVQSPALTERDRARLWAWACTGQVIIWDLEGAVRSADIALEKCRELEDDLWGRSPSPALPRSRTCRDTSRRRSTRPKPP